MRQRSTIAGRAIAVTIAVISLLWAFAAAAQATTASQDIASGGPLSNIWVGNDLTCQVQHTGNPSFEFFPPNAAPGDCGTFVSILPTSGSGTVYGPSFPVGTATPFTPGSGGYAAFTPVSQPAVSGSGTAASPFVVTTTVNAGRTLLNVTQTDTYVVGNEYYRTDITLHNTSQAPISGRVFRGGDCYLQGSDLGFGAVDPSSGGIACTQNANDSPSGLIEEFAALTTGNHYLEANYSTVWSDIALQTDLPNTCNCGGFDDNGAAINWDYSIPAGGSTTFSSLTNFSTSGALVSNQISATGGQTFTGQAPASVSGTLATFTVPQPNATASQYGAIVDWGDGSTSAGTISGASGSFTVSGSHTYTSGGSYTITVAINGVGSSSAAASVTDTANISSAPSVVVGAGPVVSGSSGAGFSGSVVPEGFVTSAHFEYGLDARYRGSGASGVVYDQSTPAQVVGSDFSSHAVSASVSGLLPNALYHVRLVASNSLGTVFGADQTFKTGTDPAPPKPVLGKEVNVRPVSGLVFIRPPAGKSLGHFSAALARAALAKGNGYVPLTEARQIPTGSQIDARQGSLQVSTASIRRRGKPQVGTFGGGVFKLTQARTQVSKGLSTLSLLEGAFPGAPSYASCKAKGTTAAQTASTQPTAQTARLSSKILQTLRATDHGGHFRTRGRYSAGTVRGTQWSTQDQCNGTLTIVRRGTITVQDFARRKTITVHAGHRYLAKAINHKHK